MGQIIEDIRTSLQSLKDDDYKEFHRKLMPTVLSDSVIGVPVPLLRKFAKKICNIYTEEEIFTFMDNLPHKYYEENNLHGFLIEQIKDYDKCIKALNEFLPYVNNWATCDSIKPVTFQKNISKLIFQIKKWIVCDETYVIRFAIVNLMKYYLDKDFSIDYINMVLNVKSDEYYVNMARAWFFATALAKQYKSTFPIIKNNALDLWTHNMTIQKAIESRRISQDKKIELKKYKIK